MCPANGKRCNICSRYNHFAAVCRYDRDTHASSAQNSRQPGGYQNRRKRRVKRTMETDLDSDQSSDDEFLTKSIAHMHMVKKHMDSKNDTINGE